MKAATRYYAISKRAGRVLFKTDTRVLSLNLSRPPSLVTWADLSRRRHQTFASRAWCIAHAAVTRSTPTVQTGRPLFPTEIPGS